MRPNPNVDIVINEKPKTTVFFEPMQFLIDELKGANNICAREKIDKIRETKNSLTLAPFAHFLSAQKVGRKDASFNIIKLPMQRAIREENRMRLFTSGEYFSCLTKSFCSSLFRDDELCFLNANSICFFYESFSF